MKIIVAGVKKEVKDGITIAQLLVQEQVQNPEYVTVSVNDAFAKKENFEIQKLEEGDEIEFLYFMGGGGRGIFQ